MKIRFWPKTSAQVAIHESATVDAEALIWDFVRILSHVTIKHDVSIGGGTEIGRGSVIEQGARIGANCFLPAYTKVGEYAFVGPGVTCTDDRHPKVAMPGDPPYIAEPPVIEEFANIGAGVILLPGVRIGHHALVGAGSVVTKDVPPHTLWRGEPARQVDPSDDTSRIIGASHPVAPV